MIENTMSGNVRRLCLAVAAVCLLVVGCGSIGATPAPSASPIGSPGPTPASTPAPTPSTGAGPVNVTLAAHAAARVFASDERWGRMVPLRPDFIGQSSWYEAFDNGNGFTVQITQGSGDCQAGCIEHHTWTYSVDATGTVTPVEDSGDPMDVPPAHGGGNGPVRVTAQLTAGPTCPVQRDPPDPNCAPRSVANAAVTIYDADGAQVATGTSDEQGTVAFDVPQGAYFVVAQTVEGLIQAPDAQAFAALGGDQVALLFQYDTGIR